MGAPTHTDLIGLPDSSLLKRAPDATHQHYKGGLYRDLGQVRHYEDGLLGNLQVVPGPKLRGYVHRYPHEQGAWVREEEEFLGDHEGAPRFRPLAGATTTIPAERIDHGRVRDADTGGDFLINDQPCRMITENGIVFLANL